MNWREKLAVLKMVGFNVVDHGEDRSISDGKYFRYLVDWTDNPESWAYGAGDTLPEATEKAWLQYERVIKHEKVY